MSDKIQCEIVKDLLPSYVDGLVSEVTNEAVEKHIEACTECKRVLDSMRESSKTSVNKYDQKEIDFLKKTRRRNIGAIIMCVFAVALVFVGALTAKVYFIGSDVSEEFVNCRLSVVGNELSVGGGALVENMDIPFVNFKEEDGVVTVSFKSVRKSRFHRSGYLTSFTAENEIIRVLFDDRIVWDSGKAISKITSDAFKSYHRYIGAMSQNIDTANALGVYDVLGSFSNELHISSEPYSWKLIVYDDIPALYRKIKEEYMRSYAYAILALIDNLSEVKFQYTVDGEVCELSVTADEASEFAGGEIKQFGKEVYLLQELIEKTVLGASKPNVVGNQVWLNEPAF